MHFKCAIAIFLSIFCLQSSVAQTKKTAKKPAAAKAAAKPAQAKMNAALSATQAVLQNQGAQSNPALKVLLDKNAGIDQSFGSKNPAVWAQQWAFSRGIFENYYAANKDNLLVEPFADVLRTLLRLSYARRAENKAIKNGFAKDFARELFLYAALDISSKWNHWQNPLTKDEEGVIYQKLNDCGELSFGAGFLTLLHTRGNSNAAATVTMAGLVSCRYQVIPATATGFVGDHHFDEHLAPGFYRHFHRVFRELATAGQGENKAELIVKFQKLIDAIRVEHTAQLEVNKQSYVKAGNLPGLDVLSAMMAVDLIPPRAHVLRESMFETAIVDLRETGSLDKDVANQLLVYLTNTDAKSSDQFLVARYLNTRLRVQKGDSISIKAAER